MIKLYKIDSLSTEEILMAGSTHVGDQQVYSLEKKDGYSQTTSMLDLDCVGDFMEQFGLKFSEILEAIKSSASKAKWGESSEDVRALMLKYAVVNKADIEKDRHPAHSEGVAFVSTMLQSERSENRRKLDAMMASAADGMKDFLEYKKTSGAPLTAYVAGGDRDQLDDYFGKTLKKADIKLAVPFEEVLAKVAEIAD